MSRARIAILALAASCAVLSTPVQAIQRAFVASTGSDAAACTLAAPCRSFTAALAVVDPGGEIVALDAAGFGAVTVTKSVTITANPGFYAGIAAATGNAVTIATPGVEVILRGLNINGIGASHGVHMTNGALLSIENCVISNFTTMGVRVSGVPATVRIADSLIRDNAANLWVENGPTATIVGSRIYGGSDAGLVVRGTAAGLTTGTLADSIVSGGNVGVAAYSTDPAGTTRLHVVRSTVSNNSVYGVLSSNGSGIQYVSIGASLVTENGTGLVNLGAGLLESQGNNLVRSNSTNSTGTITNVGSM